MKTKQFTHGITFFVALSMYQQLKIISDQKKIALSELLRQAVAGYLEAERQGQEAK
jgi:hypothetical protein